MLEWRGERVEGMGLSGSGWGRRGRGSGNLRMTWGSLIGEE